VSRLSVPPRSRDQANNSRAAYVDARMSEMRPASNMPHAPAASPPPAQPDGRTEPILRGKQPAGAGKLHEIDLGPDATRLNVLRTQAAAARINDQGVYVEEPQPPPTGPKARFRRGRRPRRTSEDLERDHLVDTLLAEAKREHPALLTLSNPTAVDMYAQPEEPTPRHMGGDERPADDLLVDEFTREFNDTLHSRNQARKTVATALQRTGDPKSKGPKLGGSRNARAAMHRAKEAAAKQKR
jgi:hypothetical protein